MSSRIWLYNSPASATVGFAILAIQNVRAFCVDEQVTCSCYNSIYVFTELKLLD